MNGKVCSLSLLAELSIGRPLYLRYMRSLTSISISQGVHEDKLMVPLVKLVIDINMVFRRSVRSNSLRPPPLINQPAANKQAGRPEGAG